MGRKALSLAVDLTVKDICQSIKEESLKTYGRVDILVNNAGIALLESAESISEEYWDST
ncbi:MAG: SDR family NAD(P)-dependent oxidoreductase [Spirochaetia bacterium]|jgi:2-deoxy-D-gluconate 3-dehydrogenase